MVNQQKIIAMTKLALYDKHEGSADRAANDYFRHDYIYRKNLGARFAVGFGGVIILAFYWLRVILLDGVDIFEINIQRSLMDSILFILAILAIYSLIGMVQGTREYYLVQKRLQQYHSMLRFLERMSEYGRKTGEGDAGAASGRPLPPDARPPERKPLPPGARPVPRPVPPGARPPVSRPIPPGTKPQDSLIRRTPGDNRLRTADSRPPRPPARPVPRPHVRPGAAGENRLRPTVRPATHPKDAPLVRRPIPEKESE